MSQLLQTAPTDQKELASAIVQVLDQRKAKDISLLYVADQTYMADYFVICEGNSNTHLRSLCGEVEYQLSLVGIAPHHVEGYQDGNWILMDFGSVIVHLFHPESRNFYNLEKLWSSAQTIDTAPIIEAFTKEQAE